MAGETARQAMSTIGEFFEGVLQKIKQSPRQQPSVLVIPPNHTDLPPDGGKPLTPNEDYFQVRVNELYLTNSRKWLREIDPMVYVVSEFTYDGATRTVPFVVGPALIEQNKQDAPAGAIIRNTRVAGLHPYRGGRITLSVMLCEVQRKNYGKEFLAVTEKVAGALDYSTMLSMYLKVAGVVIDGVQKLFGTGATVPLVALRKEMDPDANDALAPAYFALIDSPGVDMSQLWVREGQLLTGPSLEAALPYRAADYVLYSLVRPKDGKRNDLELLPFNSLWKRVEEEATKPTDDHYKSAKANMMSLYQTLTLSPDLTRPQAEFLADDYADTMKKLHERAVRFSNLGPAAEGGGAAIDTLKETRARSLKVLDL